MFNPPVPPIRVFVKLFSKTIALPKPGVNTPESLGEIPILAYELTGNKSRDISFPYGVNVGGKYLYIMVSTVYSPVVGGENETSGDISGINSVFYTITYI